MKRMKKAICTIFGLMTISLLTGCQTTESLKYDFDDYEVTQPTDNWEGNSDKVTIDGILDESIWQQVSSQKVTVVSKSYDDVYLESLAFMDEKGIYFGVTVFDFAFYYVAERSASRNTSAEIYVATLDLSSPMLNLRLNPTGEGNKLLLGKNASYVYNEVWTPGIFYWEGNGIVDGPVNTSQINKYVCEAFVPWYSLGTTYQEHICYTPAFNHVESANVTETERTWNGQTDVSIHNKSTWNVVSNEAFGDYETLVNTQLRPDLDMNLDGELNEAVWGQKNPFEYTYELSQEKAVTVTTSVHMTGLGLYLGVEVLDPYLYYSDSSVRAIGLNSGLEVLIAPYGAEVVNKQAKQLRITANNVTQKWVGDPITDTINYPWKQSYFPSLSATKINGVLNATEITGNTGFTAEIFLPWASLGLSIKPNDVLVFPVAVHSESETSLVKSSPWAYCNFTGLTTRQHNPTTSYPRFNNQGVVYNYLAMDNIHFSDVNLVGDTYDITTSAKLSPVSSFVGSASGPTIPVVPELDLPTGVTYVDNGDDTFTIKIPAANRSLFIDGQSFTASFNSISLTKNITYSPVMVDGDVNDSVYGLPHILIDNSGTNNFEMVTKTYFGNQGLYLGYDVKDSLIGANTRLETYFILGEEAVIGNAWQIRFYIDSKTVRSYELKTPEASGFAWKELTATSPLQIDYEIKTNATGYMVEVFIPYTTFNLESVPSMVKIQTGYGYYRDSAATNATVKTNGIVASNYTSYDNAYFQTYNQNGFVGRPTISDIYLDADDIVTGFYQKEIIVRDEQGNVLNGEMSISFTQYFTKQEDGLTWLLRIPVSEKAAWRNGREITFTANDITVPFFVYINDVDINNSDGYFNFDDGTMSNQGSDSTIVATSKTMSTTKVVGGIQNTFVDIAPVFVTGRGENSQAMRTNYKYGPYTHISGFDLSTNDFTISTWAYIGDAVKLGNGNNQFLFGNRNADSSANGFRLTIRDLSTNSFAINYRYTGMSTSTTKNISNFAYNTWNNFTVTRAGELFAIYLNGVLVVEITLASALDFGSTPLVFGAYTGETWDFKDNYVLFDDIRLYRAGLNQSGVLGVYEL